MKRIIYLLTATLFLIACNQKERMANLAEENIRQSVDNPNQLKILAVSEPDSAFGTNFFSQNEIQGMVMIMQKVSEEIMRRTNNMTEFNPNDRDVMFLAERQMRAMAEIRPLIRGAKQKGEWSGWKIKVDYEAINKNGLSYKAERWMFLDKDGRNIFKTIEIPIP